MKRLIGMTAAVLLAASAAPALAQNAAHGAADKGDMQCFAVVAYLAGQSEEGSVEHTGLASGMMYFLGRLEGRAPGTDWLRALSDYILAPDEARLTSELEAQRERCGLILQTRGQALVEWGAKLTAAAQARGD